MSATIQLARGVDEQASDVRITRSKDGNISFATFIFQNPACWTEEKAGSEVTGMFMIDEEGELVTRDVKGKFINGQPSSIEAVFQMDGEDQWERFMRFMNRYAEANGMDFTKS